MPWNAVAGATFRIEDGPVGQKHLYFVVNDPMTFPAYGLNSCLVVNASTPGKRFDDTCILTSGCHPAITHDSFIFYGKATVLQAPLLEKNVKNRIYIPGQPAALNLVKFIVSYMHEADELADDLKAFALRIESQLNAKPA